LNKIRGSCLFGCTWWYIEALINTTWYFSFIMKIIKLNKKYLVTSIDILYNFFFFFFWFCVCLKLKCWVCTRYVPNQTLSSNVWYPFFFYNFVTISSQFSLKIPSFDHEKLELLWLLYKSLLSLSDSLYKS